MSVEASALPPSVQPYAGRITAAHSLEKGPWVQETFGAPMEPHYLETADWPLEQKVA